MATRVMVSLASCHQFLRTIGASLVPQRARRARLHTMLPALSETWTLNANPPFSHTRGAASTRPARLAVSGCCVRGYEAFAGVISTLTYSTGSQGEEVGEGARLDSSFVRRNISKRGRSEKGKEQGSVRGGEGGADARSRQLAHTTSESV